MKDERMKMKSFTRMRYCTTTNNIELHRENCSKFSNPVAWELGNYLEIQLEFVKFKWHAFRTFWHDTFRFWTANNVQDKLCAIRFSVTPLAWMDWPSTFDGNRRSCRSKLFAIPAKEMKNVLLMDAIRCGPASPSLRLNLSKNELFS